MIVGPNQVLHGRTDDVLDPHSQEPGKTLVAVQDGVVAAENRGAFIHPLHENTVGMIGPLQREHLLPGFAAHDNGIHFAGTNGMEGFLDFAQACKQVPARQSRVLLRGAVFLPVGQSLSLSGSDYSRIFKSRPKSTFFRSDMSPMSLRSGCGSRLMSVGTATICWSLARCACW